MYLLPKICGFLAKLTVFVSQVTLVVGQLFKLQRG
jgi:hypothetical protein